jgi:hypothetical protein
MKSANWRNLQICKSAKSKLWNLQIMKSAIGRNLQIGEICKLAKSANYEIRKLWNLQIMKSANYEICN